MSAAPEAWRPVVDYEGLYEVSDRGQIRSYLGRGPGPLRSEPTIRQPHHAHRAGYLSISLSRGGRVRHQWIHALVLAAFVGPRPTGYQAAHLDGNPRNNALANLQWKTRAENELDKVRRGTLRRGSQLKHAKLTEAQVVEIRERFARGDSVESIATAFGVKRTNIPRIVQGQSWRHVGGPLSGPRPRFDLAALQRARRSVEAA